ncbi:hypothetical protein HDU98_003797 [Podochytrium sp. JEL0797]|nr:hypothetical protein HDU98_003797 [Podochytrium sp. JEL0797]
MGSRFFGTQILANTGSTARDHLANERTFLAWARTAPQPVAAQPTETKPHRIPSLGVIAAHAVSSPDRLASATLIGIGALFLGFGTVRYFSTLKHLTQGKFQPNTKGIALMVASSSVITVSGLAVVLVPQGTWFKAGIAQNANTTINVNANQ